MPSLSKIKLKSFVFALVLSFILTALALAKYLSDLNSNLKTIKTQFYSFLIIFIPIALIILQPVEV